MESKRCIHAPTNAILNIRKHHASKKPGVNLDSKIHNYSEKRKKKNTKESNVTKVERESRENHEKIFS